MRQTYLGEIYQSICNSHTGVTYAYNELLEVMAAALPPDEPAGHIFLHHLPGDLKDLATIQFHQLEVRKLAKFGDVIWDARNSKKTVVAAVQPATLDEETTLGEETALERAVAALTIHNKKKCHGSKSRGGGRPRGCRGAAWEAARAKRLSVTSTRSLENMLTTAPAPRHAPGWETSRPGYGSCCHRRRHTQPPCIAERQR